jgi:hypothetical protein
MTKIHGTSLTLKGMMPGRIPRAGAGHLCLPGMLVVVASIVCAGIMPLTEIIVRKQTYRFTNFRSFELVRKSTHYLKL